MSEELEKTAASVASVATQKQCEQCGEPFVARRWWARFCVDACKVKFHIQQRRVALHEYHLYRKPSDAETSMSSTGAST